jgi:hypothetical protein
MSAVKFIIPKQSNVLDTEGNVVGKVEQTKAGREIEVPEAEAAFFDAKGFERVGKKGK